VDTIVPIFLPSTGSNADMGDLPRWVVWLILLGAVVGGFLVWTYPPFRVDTIVDRLFPTVLFTLFGAAMGFLCSGALSMIAYALEPVLPFFAAHWRAIVCVVVLSGAGSVAWHRHVLEVERERVLHIEQAHAEQEAREIIDSNWLPVWPMGDALPWTLTRSCPEHFVVGPVRGEYHLCYPDWLVQR
jgi:hypothetical protein